MGVHVTVQRSIARVTWLDVWIRAVVVVAYRRAAAVWVGSAIVTAVLFGPTAMHPSDVTQLARHSAGAAVVLGATWLLVFVPTARVLIRGDGARYLRSLPGPTFAPRAIAIGALIVLQLPWLALWVIGEGLAGLAVVAVGTVVIATVAAWQPPRSRAPWPGWTQPHVALRAIHLRGLRRRAGDALVRGSGLAILAGVAAGLFIRNNRLADADAASVGTAVMAVVLVPATAGAHVVLLETHRSTTWLAHSLGITRGTRIAALVAALAILELAASAIAVAAAAIAVGADASTLVWLGGTAAAVAVGSALGRARVLLAAEPSPTAAARCVVGSIGVAALVVVTLGLFGVVGVVATTAVGAFALLSLREPPT